MSSQTPNINLTLPTGAEKVSRQIINDNNTKIDTAIGTLNDKLTPVDITSQCTIDSNKISNAYVYTVGKIIIISLITKTNINGTSQTVLTLPSGMTMKKVQAYAGAYGGTFVGEAIADSNTVRMNISTSTNNGNVMLTTVLN